MISASGAIDFSILIVVASIVAFIAFRLRQPLILAYVIAGILVGDAGFGIIGDMGYLRSLTPLALAFLLFATGLELSIKDMKPLRNVIVWGTIAETLLIGGVGAIVVRLFGFTWWEAAYLGLILAFSSTALVVKVLRERGMTGSLTGRILVGTLVMQDVVLVVALSGFAILSGKAPATILTVILEAIGLAVIVPFAPLLGAVLLFGITLLLRKLVKRIYSTYAAWPEYLIIATFGIVFALSIIADQLGFSVAIGAFLAGVVIANTEHASEVASMLSAPTALFTMFFFATLGFVITITAVGSLIVPLLVLLVLAFIVRPLLVMLVIRLFGYTPRTALGVGLHMTSVPVLALVLIDSGTSLGLIRPELATLAVLWIVISIVGSSYANPAIFGWIDRLSHLFPRLAKQEKISAVPVSKSPRLVLIEVTGITDEDLRRAVRTWHDVLLIDHRASVLSRARRYGLQVSPGKAALERVLRGQTTNLELVVSGNHSVAANARLITSIKAKAPAAKVIVLAEQSREAFSLQRAGADLVVTETELRSQVFGMLRKGTQK